MNRIIDILLSDTGEKSTSILASILTFFGLDKIMLVYVNPTIAHEIITGFIKMFFSIITAIIVYFILELIKKYRNDKTGI